MSESAPPNCPALSIVIPAYQEEKRIGATLREIANYAARKLPGEIELIIVSAGSTDGTVKVAGQYKNQISGNFTVIDLRSQRARERRCGLGCSLLRENISYSRMRI